MISLCCFFREKKIPSEAEQVEIDISHFFPFFSLCSHCPFTDLFQEPTSNNYIELADKHLKSLIRQLVRECELPEKWVDIIYYLSVRASEIVRPDLKGENGEASEMDIRRYVKVVPVPEGDVNDCMYVDGVIFAKNVVHKSMRTNIPNARVMLLDNSVEIDNMAVGPRLHSFDVLLQQEKHYLQMIVNKVRFTKRKDKKR